MANKHKQHTHKMYITRESANKWLNDIFDEKLRNDYQNPK